MTCGAGRTTLGTLGRLLELMGGSLEETRCSKSRACLTLPGGRLETSGEGSASGRAGAAEPL